MRLSLKMLVVVLLFLFSSFVFADNATKIEEEQDVVMDTIHVHGMVLKGKITDIGPNKLSFRLLNIDGINHIPYKDIDAIYTKYNYNISYGSERISGKVIGIVNQESLKVESSGKIKVIKIADIDNFAMTVEDDDSVENYVRNTLPYISGNVNLGMEFDSGASIKNKTNMHVNLLRKKAQNEIYFHFDYTYETTETSTTSKVENKDEMNVILGDRYFYDSDDFVYAGVMGDYDRPRNIDARLAPSLGYGHHFRLGKDRWVQPWIGLAYVWTRYTDEILYPDISFTAAAFGVNAKYQFDDVAIIHKLRVDGELLYYPSIADPEEDWITRANLGFTIPIYQFLTMKLALQWINDSTPEPSVGNNKTKTNLMFGVDF